MGIRAAASSYLRKDGEEHGTVEIRILVGKLSFYLNYGSVCFDGKLFSRKTIFHGK
ncbi:Arginine biosynthesis bifunctional protein ArgJ chloroplastic [Bienertia sinuspersici]